MKVNTITRTVKIDDGALLRLFIDAVYGDARVATGKDATLYKAFSNLIGISDVAVVKIANTDTKKEYRITVTEFREWLPTVFAEFAREVLETNNA